MINATGLLEYSSSVQVYSPLKGRFDKSLEILYKKWSHFVKEMMLNDLLFSVYIMKVCL